VFLATTVSRKEEEEEVEEAGEEALNVVGDVSVVYGSLMRSCRLYSWCR
jgi:hypothetical protein